MATCPSFLHCSNAFTDLRKEMDIHGDMATVLVEATKLVKKQKVRARGSGFRV